MWSKTDFLKGGLNNCNGALSIWTKAGPANVASAALDEWVDCALHKECVCPEGSSRASSRQDQAALTLVLRMHNLTCDGTSNPHPQRGAHCHPPDAAGYVDPKKCKWIATHGHYRKNGVCSYGEYKE